MIDFRIFLLVWAAWPASIVARHLIRKRMAEDRLEQMMAGLEEMVERRKEELNG